MQGQHYICRTEDQRRNFIEQVRSAPLPFLGQVREPVHPKTTQQIRYAHSLCNSLAAYKQVSPEAAKRDAKVEFGVVIVCTSVITGERAARLKSFADYTREEMEAFNTQMEVYLTENRIPFTPPKER